MPVSRGPALASVSPYTPEAFCAALANENVSAEVIAGNSRAQFLSGYLGDLEAKTLVVESPYVDGDYLDDFAAYYVLCFPNYERWCKRLHVFDAAFDEDDLRAALTGEDPDLRSRLDEHYIGFVVARPLPEALIGRTVLRTYPSDNGRRHYPATRPYDANVFGLSLTVESLAYQEQDTVMAACATVALWSALHKTHDLFKTPAPRPAVITRTANKVVHSGRPIPTHGLNVRQICRAIREVGLEPEVFDIGPHTPLASLLYGHVRAGLPVVLGVEVESVGPHAITVCGFSMLDNEHLSVDQESAGTGLASVARRINEFYAHDDQVGPFSRMRVNAPPSRRSAGTRTVPYFDGSWEQGAGSLRLIPVVAVVPVYHKIRVTLLEARSWLHRVDWLAESLVDKESSREWDLSLTTTNHLKESVRELDLPVEAKADLLLAPQPKYIWRSIMTVDGAPVLELWIDATDTARSLPVFRALWLDQEHQRRCHRLLEISQEPWLAEKLTPRLLELLVRETRNV